MHSDLYQRFFLLMVQPHKAQLQLQHWHLWMEVPIKAPVAGISVGLITGRRWMTMLDIQGLKILWRYDFKVGGTHNGITAIQMDLKVDGLTPEIIKEAFEKARKARIHILTMLC